MCVCVCEGGGGRGREGGGTEGVRGKYMVFVQN